MNLKIVFRLLAFSATILLFLFFNWEWIEPAWLNRISFYSVRFILFFTGTELFKHIFFHYYRKNKRLKVSSNDNFIQAVNNLHYIIIFFVGIATILRFFALDIIEVITSLSIVAAAIAIISKDYLSNIISGLITVFTRELEIEDNIQILHHKGKVQALTLSKVVLLNDDDDVVFIPNNVVFSNDFINYSKRLVRKTSIDFELKNEDMPGADAIEDHLKETIHEYWKYIDETSIYLRIEEIAFTHVAFKFQYTLLVPNRDLEREIRRKVRRGILKLIK